MTSLPAQLDTEFQMATQIFLAKVKRSRIKSAVHTVQESCKNFKTDDVCELFCALASFLQLPSFEVSRFFNPFLGR